MADGWTLDDAEDRAVAAPRAFFIPAREVRAGLAPGDLVKLIFLVVGGEADGDGERMWVEVTDVVAGPTPGYVGRLDNDPLVIDLEAGARVEFGPQHVVDVHADEPDPLAGQALFVSARLVEDDTARIGAAAFDPADADRDLGDGRTITGWQAFVGDESDEELDDPTRVRLPSLSWFLQREPELWPLVRDHDGTAGYWTRDGDANWTRRDG